MIEPALIDRFRADILRLAPEIEPDGRLALAVSGGPDSMAMLVLASNAFPGRIVAATVDHRLRRESADEAAMVARACTDLGIAHTTLVIEAPPGASGNLHAWARQERYALLKRWSLDTAGACLCTAHHAEDQAETFLMRAARASGLPGLAAVRARRDDDVAFRDLSRTEIRPEGTVISVHRHPVVLVRPLLRWRRGALRDVAKTAGMPFVDDPSNRDPAYDRARFRTWLEQASWLDPVKIGRSAEYLAEADADLLAISQWLWKQRALPCGDHDARFDMIDLPRGVRRYIARMAIESVQMVNGLPHEQGATRSIEPLLDALEAGRGATHGGVQASAKGTVWHFRSAPPRNPPHRPRR